MRSNHVKNGGVLRGHLETARRNLAKQKEITADLRQRLSASFARNKQLYAENVELRYNARQKS